MSRYIVRGLHTWFLVFIGTGLCSLRGQTAIFSDESAWRDASGSFLLETWEGFSPGTQISSLPGLGIQFELLSDNETFPSVQLRRNTGGNVRSGTNVLLNDNDFALPGRGPIKFAVTDTPLKSVGYWNTGGDDSTLLSVFDQNGVLIESTLISGFSFGGIVSSTPIFRVEINEAGGNGFFTLDDLQVSLGQSISTLTGDLNGDEVLNAADLVALVSEINDGDAEIPPGFDVNNDQVLDRGDLVELARLMFEPARQ